MQLAERTLLRLYLQNTDRVGLWQLASDVLLGEALRAGLAGATVLEGCCGLDGEGKLRAPAKWSIVEHRPLILEFHDEPAAIGRFLGLVVQTLPRGLATLERSRSILYRRRSDAPPADAPLVIPAPPPAGAALPAAAEFPIMRSTQEGQLLRIFIDLADQHGGRPLYEVLIAEAARRGLAGATAFRPPEGFGTHRELHSVKFLDYASDLPLLIEIVDTTAKIESFLPFLDEVVSEGLVTIEGVRLLRFGPAAAT